MIAMQNTGRLYCFYSAVSVSIGALVVMMETDRMNGGV